MANTRFKTENGILVTGEIDSEFQTQTLFSANVTVNSAVLIVNGALIVGNSAGGGVSDLSVTGDLLVSGNLVYTNTSVEGGLTPAVDGDDLGNPSFRFDGFFANVNVYGYLNPSSNTIPLGNSTARWVVSANTLDLSGEVTGSGNVTINTDAFKVNASGKQVAINTASYSGALNVTGAVNVNGDIVSTANVAGALIKAGSSYIVTNTGTINSSSATVVDEFANSAMKAVKYLAYAENNTTTNRYMVEITGLNVGSSLLITQYGEVNNAVLGTFTMAKVGANIQLSYTDSGASAGNTSTVTVIRTILS